MNGMSFAGPTIERPRGGAMIGRSSPASHFLTMWKEIEGEPENDQGAMPPASVAVYGASADMARC